MHMHMHMHHAPCPMPNAQALAQEINKLNTELHSRFGCFSAPRFLHLRQHDLPDKELPSKPWDTQGQCKVW